MVGAVGYTNYTGFGTGYTFGVSSSGLKTDDAKQSGRVSPSECETCKNRKYQDGSDEMVSFKTAQHMDPLEAGNRVRAHEMEHVTNAYDKAEVDGGEVLSASVQIHTAVCPECGTTYVSGGTTTSQIKYSNEDNPYQKARKMQDAASGLVGSSVDLAV